MEKYTVPWEGFLGLVKELNPEFEVTQNQEFFIKEWRTITAKNFVIEGRRFDDRFNIHDIRGSDIPSEVVDQKRLLKAYNIAEKYSTVEYRIEFQRTGLDVDDPRAFYCKLLRLYGFNHLDYVRSAIDGVTMATEEFTRKINVDMKALVAV